MKKLMAFMALAVAALSAHAKGLAPSQLIVHGVSIHSAKGYNNDNFGLGLQWANSEGDGPAFGTYYNSERKQTVYAGYAWSTHIGDVSGIATNADLLAGGATGYSIAKVIPFVIPSLSFQLTPTTALRLSYAAKVEKGSAHALHLSIGVGL
jgi:hypothetical protein